MILKRCPFCGGRPSYGHPVHRDDPIYHRAFCLDCGASTALFADPEHARLAWNHRTLTQDDFTQPSNGSTPKGSTRLETFSKKTADFVVAALEARNMRALSSESMHRLITVEVQRALQAYLKDDDYAEGAD